MKRLSLLIVPIALLFLGVFVFTGTKEVKAAYGDRASYTLDPFTFWQSCVSTDGWNQWELSAYKKVVMPDDSNIFSDSTPGKEFNPRIYDQNNHSFDHAEAGTQPKNDVRECTVNGVAHGYVATIERNGWSGKWIPDETESQEPDPPKWGVTTKYEETTSFIPYLMDNNPYTVRSWVTARGLKKNRTYTWVFDAYIEDGAYMAKLGGNVPVDNKYAKIVGTTLSGKILFVRYLDITTEKKTFKFNFDMDSANSAIKVEMMYGAFFLYADRDDEYVKYKKQPELLIKHEEVCWTGTIHIENCDIIQGNLNEPQVETTTRRQGGGGGGGGWADEPEKITGVKVKSKAKKSVLISWSKDEYATKYQVKYGLKKNFKGAKSKKTSKRKLTIKGLKRKKTYYFKVRGYNDEYYGPYSARKKCKVK